MFKVVLASSCSCRSNIQERDFVFLPKLRYGPYLARDRAYNSWTDMEKYYPRASSLSLSLEHTLDSLCLLFIFHGGFPSLSNLVPTRMSINVYGGAQLKPALAS